MPIHPKIDDQSGLPYGPWIEEWKIVVGFENYEVNHKSEVRNKETERILKSNKSYQLVLRQNGKRHSKIVYQLALQTFFPHIPQNNRTCDHFDENHDNHDLNNLWWQTPSQQIIKSNQLRPRNSGPAASKPVEQWPYNNIPDAKKKETFVSVIEASRKTGVDRGNITKCLSGKLLSAGGFLWKFQELESQIDLPNEEWKSNDVLLAALQERNPKAKLENIKKVQISNLGRIQTINDIKTKGAIVYQTCYRMYAKWFVHQLVWMVFGDGRPVPRANDKLMILHNDDLEKDSEGCVSNAIVDLRLGTQSENMKSHHRAKAKKRHFSQIS